MARYDFGASLADFVVTPSDGLWGVAPGAVVTFWASADGDVQYTDLLDAGGSAISTVTADEQGFIPLFAGPDGIIGMWADAGSGTRAWIQGRSTASESGSEIGKILVAIKPTDTERASTTTLTADPHLTLDVVADAVYAVDCIGVWTGASGGFKASWSVPDSAGMVWTDNDGVGVTTPSGTVSFTGTTGTSFRGTLSTGETAGAITLLWAQASSNASATSLRAGCALTLTRIA
jgi:hypothetical protein